VRLPLCVLAIGCSALCWADRLISIPTAHKIPFRAFKYELRMEPQVRGLAENYLGIGVSTSIEVEIRTFTSPRDRQVGTFDLTYNIISPITDFTPGFAFGVQDALNRTPEGPRPFFATTFRNGFYGIGGESPSDVTLGIVAIRRRVYPFIGASIPFSKAFRLLAEHDGLILSVGLELRPVKDIGLKWIVRERNSLLGLEIQHRF
jgi:hypothetical protein